MARARGIRLFINMVVTNQSLDEIEPMLDVLRGARHRPQRPAGRLRPQVLRRRGAPVCAQRRAGARHAPPAGGVEAPGTAADVRRLDLRERARLGGLRRAVAARARSGSACMAGRFYIHIEPNGDVHPCVQHGADFTPKNIVRDGLEAALAQRPASRLRRLLQRLSERAQGALRSAPGGAAGDGPPRLSRGAPRRTSSMQGALARGTAGPERPPARPAGAGRRDALPHPALQPALHLLQLAAAPHARAHHRPVARHPRRARRARLPAPHHPRRRAAAARRPGRADRARRAPRHAQRADLERPARSAPHRCPARSRYAGPQPRRARARPTTRCAARASSPPSRPPSSPRAAAGLRVKLNAVMSARHRAASRRAARLRRAARPLSHRQRRALRRARPVEGRRHDQGRRRGDQRALFERLAALARTNPRLLFSPRPTIRRHLGRLRPRPLRGRRAAGRRSAPARWTALPGRPCVS